jgi:DNA polymerase-3 subunit gamma/tau
MRDGLSLLDQLIAFGGGALSEANARSMLGTIDRGHVGRIVAALARADGSALLAEVAELDRDAPDYDRALIELAALLQRIAIVQVVPEAAAHDEEFDAEELRGLAAALHPEDVQLYYQIALGGRRDLAMAPEPRSGFEMSLLRMLAFRPESEPARSGASPASRPDSPARGMAAVAARNAPVPQRAEPLKARAAPISIVDSAHWPAVVEAAQLTGMTRQFALNCVPAGFEQGLLSLRLDAAAADRRTKQIEDKLVQALSKYFGRDIRLAIEIAAAELPTPARQRALAEQDRVHLAAAAFDEDPAVRGLRERFGAEVDVASVKPLNQEI